VRPTFYSGTQTMRRIAAILFLLMLVGCNSPAFAPADASACQAPFVDLATSGASPDDQAVLLEAAEDFCAVVAGRKPVHAEFDADAPLPADGGTTYYVGRRYTLTVLSSFSSFGSFHGTARGPIITFDESFAPGNTREISSIRVFPASPAPER
jgi:hypothetical protein